MADPKEIIANISDIPTLPDVVAKVNQLVNSTKASAGDINDVISRDISLSSKVLKMVNSSFYGFPRRITSITHAVVILGFSTIRNLALSAFVFSAFNKQSKTFDQKAFWEYSIGTALSASTIGKHLKLEQKHKEDAFMGGLLHGIGKVVMCEYLPEDMEKVVGEVKSNNISFIEAEKKTLDYTHQELGGCLLEKWNLPQSIVNSVSNHTTPMECVEEDRNMAFILHLATSLTSTLCIGNCGDDKVPIISAAELEALGLTTEDLGAIMDTILTDVPGAMSFLEMQ
jgi:HD-like signal output (HDOD) protein